ncbi:MAG: hypothetical protein Q3972_07260, partial [Corynebacterium sp.]|nr:hypothetical protein [Corynebacterium sp.]
MRSAKKLITLYSLLALSGPTLAACGGSSELFGSSLSSGSSGSSGGSGSGRSQETTGEDYVPAEQQEDVTKPIGYYISLSLSPDSDVTGTDSYADSQPLRIYLRLKDGAPFTPSSVTFGGTDYALSQDNEGNFYFDYIVAENNAPELQLTAVKTADGVIWDGAMSLYFNKPVELPTESSTDPHAEPDAEPDAELGSESTPESTNPSTATSSTTSSTRSTTAAVPVVSPEPVPALTPEATTKASPATTAESAASATPESTSSTSTKSTTSQVIAPSEPSGEVVAEPSSSRPTTSAATSTTTTQAPEPYTVAVQWAWVDPTTVEFVATGRGESVTITDDNGAQLATVESTRGGARVRVTADGSTDLHWAINTDEVSESAGQGGVQAERIITEANGVVDAAMRISYGHVTGVDIYRVVNGTPVEQAAGSAAVGDIAVVRFSNGMTRMRDITAVDGEGLTLAIRGDSARLRSYAGLFPSSFNSDPRESNGAVEAASTGWRIALDSNGSPRAVGDEASTSRAQDNLYLLAPYLDPAVRTRAAYFLPADSVLRSHAISQIVPRAADGSALGYVGPDNYSQVASVLIAFEDAAPITLPVGTSQVDDSVISFDISSSIAGFNGGLWYQPATGYFNADTSYISALYTKVAAATNVNWPAEEAQSRVGLTDNWEDYKTNRLKGDLATVIAADPLWNSVGDNAAYRKIATSLGTPLVRESSDTVAQTDATRVALLLNWNDRGFRYDFDGMKASTLFLAYRGDTARSHLGYGAVRALSQQSRFDKWTMLLANGGRWANVFYSDGFGGTKNFAEATEKWVRRFTEFGTDYSAWAESTFKGHVFKPAETSYKGHDYSLWTNLRNFNYGGNPSNLGGTINSILSVSGPVTSPTREDGTWSPGARGGNNTQASNYMDPSMFMVVLPGTLAFGNAGLYTKEEFARVGETFTENSTAFMQRLNNFVPDYFSELTSAKYGGGIYPVWDTKGNANASYTDTDNPYMNQFAQLFRGARSAYSGGTAAYAQGPEIHFTIRLLTGYQTFTHEFTHVTDDNGPLFGGNSILRRVANWALGAETTTTNTFEQGFNYSSFAPNLTYTTV